MNIRGSLVRLLTIVPLLAMGIAVNTPRPVAAAYACNQTIQGGTIKESVVVVAGEPCILQGVSVRGSVTTMPGTELAIVLGSEIRGSVTAENARGLLIYDSTVRGSVTSTAESSSVRRSEIRGDLTLTNMTSPGSHVIEGNVVRSTLTFSYNSSEDKNIVAGNVIDVDLVCEGNTPDPINILQANPIPNTVGGAKAGECAGL